MKQFIRGLLLSLFRIPVVGYLLRLVIAAVKSPEIIQSHDLKLAEQACALQELKSVLERQNQTLVNRHEYEQIEQKVLGIEQLLPGLLNHISSFNALARNFRRMSDELSERLAQVEEKTGSATVSELRQALDKLRQEEWSHVGSLYQRLEFIRSEMLYEFRYGRAADAGTGQSEEPRILNQDKYQGLKDDLRVNLGCGQLPLEGYLNIDRRELPGVDVIASVDNLPFAENTLAELFSAHLVEHFPQEEFRRRILPYWHNLLRQGGQFRAVMPDWETMMRKHVSGEYDFEKMRQVTFGAQDYEGDFHYNMFSKESLARLLTETGFRDITFPVEGRINGDCYEFEVQAVK
jgi:predicted SAM-dependent methyltransferase